jgi:hypothetical protein
LLFEGTRWALELDGRAPLEANKVLLALGGLVSGGVRATLPGEAPHTGFALSVEIEPPPSLELDGEPLRPMGTLHGFDLASRGLGVVERVGVACDHGQLTGVAGLYAAGDVIAAAPHTLLAAAESGLRAGRAMQSG